MPDPDTIAAIGTPPGRSAIAVVRISGSEAIAVLRRICPGIGGSPEPRSVTLAKVVEPGSGDLLDQALVTFFRGPESYTGEDLVELSCHGGWLPSALVLDACLVGGARLAEAGEFTRRAYLNGKMDLLQAEAVLDLVDGRSRALHGAAVHQLERGLSKRIADIRGGLVGLEALLVHHLDFPEEDDPPVPRDEIVAKVSELAASMETLLRTAPEGELLREGALAVLAGRPNTGKSSLFNALLGEERAIVTEVPGTTRDALEGVVSLGGFPFRLVDTAGLRESEERVERLGIEVARRYLENADVVLFCVDGGRDLDLEERKFLGGLNATSVIKVRTMVDLVPEWGKESGEEGLSAIGVPALGEKIAASAVGVSVRTGEGLDGLRRLLTSMVFGGLVSLGGDAPVLTRRRHSEAVGRALEEIRGFRDALQKGYPAEVAATHLRPAETALEEVLGVIPREEVLDTVFRQFCIGK